MDYRTIIIKELSILRDRDHAMNERWKVRAYDKVLKQLKSRIEPVTSMDDLKNVDGIGAKLGEKIKEIISTGQLEQARNIDVEVGFINDLSRIYGIGPIRAKELVDKHNIKSIDDLKNKMELLNDKQKIGLKYYEDFEKRIPRKEMMKHEEYLKEKLNEIDPDIRYVIMGSYRRGLPESGDIDVLLTHENDDDSKYMDTIVKSLMKDKYITDTLGLGNKKYLGVCKLKRHRTARRIDLMWTKRTEYAYALLYFTGSQNFNIMMRNVALSKGYSLSEYGLKHLNGENRGEFINDKLYSEDDVFKFLDMTYVSPVDRK
jgi:DNA polymerase beta